MSATGKVKDKEAVAMTTAPAKKKVTTPTVKYPFWFGGSASSMAACVTHPLDLGMNVL